MNSPAPLFNSAIFNTAAFNFTNYLTKNQADQLYVSLYLMPSSAGTATANKLMITDSSNSIQSINQIGFNSMNYNGTIVTATGTELNYLHGVTPGTATASNAIVLDSSLNITGINSLTSTTITADTINAVNQFNCTGNATYSAINGNITFSGVSSNIQFSGNASVINMTGSGSKITLTGNSTSIELSGTGGHIDLSNTQASNNINTGALRCAGGAYFGNDCVFATQASINNLVISGTTDSTSISTGALVISGGIGIAKSLYVGSSTNIASTTRITGSSIPSTGSGLELAFGSTVSNIYSYNRTTSTYLNLNLNDKILIIGTNGNTSISSTTASSSTTTGALVVSGGIGCAGRVYASRYTSSNNGSNYELINGANTGLLELASSPNILRLVHSSGYALSIGSLGGSFSTGSLAPRFPIDLQATAGDIQICLFAGTSAATAAYGIGAANSAIEYHSAVNHKFYNSTLITGSTVTLGTNVFTIGSTGNAITNAGVHATGFSTTGLSSYGMSTHMHYGGSTGSVFTYDYNASAYGNLALNNNCIQCLSNGYVNINTNSTTAGAPLSVYGNSAFTRLSRTFGYLASSGSGTASGFSGRAFGIYSEYGILVDNGEIDCFSDLRMKKDVIALNEELCSRFIKYINPIQFKYNHNDNREHYGYQAQQLMAYGFNCIVGVADADEPLPEEKVYTYETNPNGELGDMQRTGESIDVPSDVRLTVCLIDMIPILHKCIQMQMKRIDEQGDEINKLKRLVYKKKHMV